MKLLICSAALVLGATAASAQSKPDVAAAVCPSGSIDIVRTSKIKPGSSIAAFHKAIADHKAWYASHGYTTDQFGTARVLDFDPATRKVTPSPDTFLTFHIGTSDVPMNKHDAAWDAYVAEYKASSDVLSTTIVCLER